MRETFLESQPIRIQSHPKNETNVKKQPVRDSPHPPLDLMHANMKPIFDIRNFTTDDSQSSMLDDSVAKI